ncbi:MAG: hypothetical protein WCP86_07790 [bacterium]
MRFARRIVWFVAVALLFVGEVRALNIERTDYKIAVPDKCTVDPQDADMDLDHLTTINLPNHNAMIIMVVDDKTVLDENLQNTKTFYKNSLKDSQESPSAMVDKHHGKAVLLTGTLNGTKYCIELGAFAGKKKGFFIVRNYPVGDKAETIKLTQASIDAFNIKEQAPKAIGVTNAVALPSVGEAHAITIERTNYTMTVPAKSSIESSSDKSVDSDHMTIVVLPNLDTLMIVVLDDKALLEETFNNTKANYMNTLKNSKEAPSDMVKMRKGKGALLNGLMNGKNYCFEMGTFAGKNAGFLIVCGYPVTHKGETRSIVQKSLQSFTVKE